ncbi:SAM-dependent methyltransferase [Kozakia baliensis]|uniref:SAM-dependent methyltransferase n=1 Tax=Kozakia baliensis TaxID=153496 RepID=UPI000498467B|nr:SAM-dependent methyltransferase [Kozakia baliensis]
MIQQSWNASIFEKIYQTNADPWRFKTSAYEKEKLARLLTWLPTHRQLHSIIELGCSIGIGTRALSEKCDHILAIDAAANALLRARHHCAERHNVTFLQAFLPEKCPTQPQNHYDFAVISELLYFLNQNDIKLLAIKLLPLLTRSASILLVNWTGRTDTPCTGDQAVEIFIQTCRQAGWEVERQERHPQYRIDLLSPNPDSAVPTPPAAPAA